MKAEEIINIARNQRRPKITDYIDYLLTDFFEQKGDFLGGEDMSILGGIGLFHDMPVTIIGQRKGNDLNENVKYNFGMAEPQGYRKAFRLMKQAEKFNRPVITLIDTPGAYPGLEAEANGQASAIAKNLAMMSTLTVPVIAVVTGEGNSGGALALGVANTVAMLENSFYAVLSPEGFASILWKDSSRKKEAAGIMKLTAQDLLELGVVDEIIREPEGGAHLEPELVYDNLDKFLLRELVKYKRMKPAELAQQRYEKFRNIS